MYEANKNTQDRENFHPIQSNHFRLEWYTRKQDRAIKIIICVTSWNWSRV